MSPDWDSLILAGGSAAGSVQLSTRPLGSAQRPRGEALSKGQSRLRRQHPLSFAFRDVQIGSVAAAGDRIAWRAWHGVLLQCAEAVRAWLDACDVE